MGGNGTSGAVVNAMTVDVEDYFHVTALSGAIDRSEWSSIRSRVEMNTRRLLQIFDEAGVSSTFFVLGWVAERFPQLVRAITEGGHELACHGYSHQLVFDQDIDVFRQETITAKKILEDVSGQPVLGYRAASYSITAKSSWALAVLAEAGFEYDSSIVPVRHDLYGIPGAQVYPHSIQLPDGRQLIEFPPSTISILGQRFPIGGGGYFRLFPYQFTRWGLRKINSADRMPFSFYLHPWEVDPAQPRIAANWKSTFRHYHNLDKCEARLLRLLQEFEFNTMSSALEKMELESTDLSEIVPAATE